MFETLFNCVEELIKMPDSDKELCRQYFEPISISKGTIIEEEGKVPQHQYFVVNGFMRNFHRNDQGEEITTDINNGPRFFTAYQYFVNREISKQNIECITNCDLLRIKRDDVDKLFNVSIILEDFTILILQKTFEGDRQRLDELATLTAEQRYLKFIKDKPNIIQNVPLQYIATYMGIKPESLSRIRKNIIS